MKILKITVEDTYIYNFALQDEDKLSRNFIMSEIKRILTDDEGCFMLKSFKFEITERVVDFSSNFVNMNKGTTFNNKIAKWDNKND